MTASLSDRFMRRLPETARRAVDCFAAEVPYYGMLPREILDGEITEFTKQHFRIFARVMLEARPPTEDEFAVAILAASRRAQEDIPLPAILAVYNVAARVGIETLRELASPDEADEVLAVSVQLQRYLQLLLPAVAAAYLEERQGLYSATSEARRDLFDALIKGTPWREAAERASVTLALAYNVLFLYMPEPAANTVVARLRAHRVQDIVDQYAREPVLTSLDGRGGIVLLPAVGKVEALLPLFSEVAGGAVTVGVSDANDPGEIADAAEEARELALLALKLGRVAGAYRLSDLLLEYQITRPGRARDLLAAAVQPLAAHPHLQQALSAYLQHEHGRQLAAKSLHVHPNTLDYRLRRVAELTGLDPAQPSAARTLAAALLAVKAR
ncbi:PucR family transcriptional regulator [Mycobacteroides immunogenum]|uniref:Transcriptional regulator n=1 Tax=Mycobacteroides immunogenum TaxID=83262 RepID=A0A0N0KPR4_9MYCO|nr:helix-turn-helix domain-containing protein [Mycobacteroides immunogenum]AMT70181.1 transcriptional regulator [Mycobacteroides immunogenum]ANO03247.1 transcriptional regulator [Mycobacteroides immunogenum]KIU40830.1 transcriptional regulator [Mycobacteroides immunogenum]KPG09953.1 transcriptional regulator [Mycobacteroides immunogenum]KPG12185.1 transcriptional regulator [Mycobacteroides immunogenum]